MINQKFYGKMRPNPPIKGECPMLVPCSKCQGKFSLEKEHKEIFIVSFYFARMKDGTLTPSLEKPDSFYRLCPSCIVKLKNWFEPTK